MKTYVRIFNKSIFQSIALCFVLMFSSNYLYSEEIKEGLSIENVHMFYFAKDEKLKVMFALLNTGNKEIIVLTESLNTGFLDDSGKNICEIGAGITAKYEGYNIVQSLYRFDPVTLKPKEATVINHHVKRKLVDVDEETGLIVRYKIKEDFGKRHKVWYGSIESTSIKPRIIK